MQKRGVWGSLSDQPKAFRLVLSKSSPRPTFSKKTKPLAFKSCRKHCKLWWLFHFETLGWLFLHWYGQSPQRDGKLLWQSPPLSLTSLSTPRTTAHTQNPALPDCCSPRCRLWPGHGSVILTSPGSRRDEVGGGGGFNLFTSLGSRYYCTSTFWAEYSCDQPNRLTY